MSDFVNVGTYATPLEACDAIGVQYRESYRGRGFGYLSLYEGGKTDGRVKIFDDSRGGMVFNQREKTMAVWLDDFDKGKKLTKAQKKQIQEQIAISRARFEAEEKAKHELAARYAALIYRTAKHCTNHPYLTTKRVPMPETLRVISYEDALCILKSYYAEAVKPEPFCIPSRGGHGLVTGSPLLVVPMRGEAKDFQAIQLIDEAGGKSFLWGCKKSGAYWQTDSLPEYDTNESLTIGIAEGVATALSVAYVKQIPVVSAMDCGNLTPVALQIRARFPRAKILILSDVGNGEKDALKAAQAVNGHLAIPKFTDALTADFERLTGKGNPTDFNDFYLAKGELL